MKGLLVFVFKDSSGYDCTANGITSHFRNLILVDKSINAPFEVGENEPYLKLVRRHLKDGEYLHAEPVNFGSGEIGPMFGGNFIYTSDSRFPSKYPIPVHDRYESQATYNGLSI